MVAPMWGILAPALNLEVMQRSGAASMHFVISTIQMFNIYASTSFDHVYLIGQA